MLREARIIMPLAGDRLHCKKVHDTLQRQLCEAFGGFTKFTGSGGWVDSRGNLLSDANIIYDVAIDSERDSPSDLIARFAIEAGRALAQDSVYVRYPNGAVDIIKLTYSEKEHRLAEALSEPDVDKAREGAERFIHALLFGGADFVITADMGDGRSAAEPEAKETKLDIAPGQLWSTRGGARTFVGKRATVHGGGWYATLVDNCLPYRAGFEYVIDTDGRLATAGCDTMLDLATQLH